MKVTPLDSAFIDIDIDIDIDAGLIPYCVTPD